MTEEEARQDDQQLPQPSENLTNHQTPKNRFWNLLIFDFIFKAFTEKKTMINEEPRQEGTPQQSSPNPTPEDPENATGILDTPTEMAIEQFKEIKQALIGDDPEWLIPRIDPRALASEP